MQFNFGDILLIALGVLVVLVLLSGIRFIPNNRIGIVEKRFGRKSVKGGFIALHGEAGYQPDVLRGGLHFLIPIQYVVHIAPLVTIAQGKIGYLFARDGEPLSAMQVLASNTTAPAASPFVFYRFTDKTTAQKLLLKQITEPVRLPQRFRISPRSTHRRRILAC